MTDAAIKFARPAETPDWCETFFGPLTVPAKSSRDMYLDMLSAPPKWFELALKLRNAIVKPFGLKTELGGEGHPLAQLPVLKNETNAFEAGIDDKHLTFTIEVNQNEGHIYVTTNIWFNSLLGKIYLTMIMPFHVMITRQSFGRVAKPVRRIVGGFREATNR